jgi:hypothetical protein
METIAVFVNDAAYARRILLPMEPAGEATHWVLVACAPRLTHRIGRWVSHGQREQWRARWAERLFAELQPSLAARQGDRVQTRVAKTPLQQVVEQLHREHGPALRLLDARRPKLAQPTEPLAGDEATETSRWTVPIAVSGGLAMVLALTD